MPPYGRLYGGGEGPDAGTPTRFVAWVVEGLLMRMSILVAAALTAVAQPGWAQGPVATPLFALAVAGAVVGLEMPAEVLRQRLAGIDLAGLEEVRAQVESSAGGALRLHLFDDAVFEAVVTDTGPTSAGGTG